MTDSARPDPTAPHLVARRLAAIREAVCMRRSAFADVIGIDRSSYTKIEDGEKPILPPLAWRIYELFGVDLNFIYLGQVGGLPVKLSSQIMMNLRALSE